MFFGTTKIIISLGREKIVVGDIRHDPAAFFELKYKDDLPKAFDLIITKIPSKSYKIILGEDVSYTVSWDKKLDIQDRDDIKQELIKWIPENFNDDQFDWKISPEGKIIAIVLTSKTYNSLKKIRTNYPNIKFETQSAVSLFWELGKDMTTTQVTQELFTYSAGKGREKGGDDMVLNVEINNEKPLISEATPTGTIPTSTAQPLPQDLPKKTSRAWILIGGFVFLLILIGVLGWFIIIKKPTQTIATPIPTSIPSPEATPMKIVEKMPNEYSILIQNGSGVAGLAATYKTELESLGFTQIETGNASSPSTTTKIMTSSSLPDSIQNALIETLKPLQAEVIVGEIDRSISTRDIVILLGVE